MALDSITFWHWWAFGGGLMLLELMVRGRLFLWVGASAALVGLALLGWATMPLGLQTGAFAVLSLACLLAWRQVAAGVVADDTRHAAEQAAQLVGRRASLLDPIQGGQGRLWMGGGQWPVAGPDAPAGATVEVTAVDGSLLQVRPV